MNSRHGCELRASKAKIRVPRSVSNGMTKTENGWAAEIQKLTPVLLSVETAPKLTANASDGTVGWRVFAKEKDVYIVAVNASGERASLTVAFPTPFGEATSILGDPCGPLDGRSLAVSFAPMEVKVIRLCR